MDKNSTTAVDSPEYYYTAMIDVKQNDVLYFGPNNMYQGYKLCFFPSGSTTGITVNTSNSCVYKDDHKAHHIKLMDTFKGGQTILSYRAEATGKVSIVLPIFYGEEFIVTKNKPMSCQSFYNYWDSKPGANLYNKELDATGALDSAGAYTNNHFTTHPIKVNAGDTIVFGPAQKTQGYHLVTADANNANLKTIGTSALTNLGTMNTFSGYQYNPYVLYSYKVPEGVSYVYPVNRAAVKEYFAVFKNSDIDTVAEYYTAMKMDANNPMTGKTALFVGDSISAGAKDAEVLVYHKDDTSHHKTEFPNTIYPYDKNLGGWAPRIAYLRQLKSYKNYSVGGASISDVRVGEGKAGNVTQQLKKAAGTSYDYILIEGGINDADENVAAGTVSASYDPSTFDTSTFAGGLEYTFYTAANLFGETASIGYMLSYRLPSAKRPHANTNMEAYTPIVQAACEKWGIQYYDMFHDQAVIQGLEIGEAGNRFMLDQLHVTKKGYDVIAPYISNFMGTLTPYSAESNTAWVDMINVAKEKAKALPATYFTADSYTAFTNAINGATGNNAAAYYTILNAVNLLVRNDTPMPFSLYDVNNPFAEAVFHKAGKFSVSSAAEYINMAAACSTASLHADSVVLQTKNISLKGHANIKIASGEKPFAATYDGQGYTITDAVISSAANYNAMFAAVSGTIKNLTIENANVTGNGWSAILVSITKGNSMVLDNVHVKNSTFTKTATNNGGAILICQPNSDSESYTVKNCSVTNCNIYVQGNVSNIGLIASRGRTANCLIDNCITSGNSIYGQEIYNVGFINGEFEAGTVSNCLALGNTFYGTCSAVGIFGATKKGTINLTNCTSDMTNISGKTSEPPAATITNTGFTAISKDAITANLYNKATATPGYVSGFNADGTAQFVEHADHKTSGKITVAAGDIVYFGPCNEGQSFHARFRNDNGSVVKVTKNELLTTGRFAQGQVIYAYKAPANGAIYVVDNVDYDDDFVVSKNQLMTVQTYYNYVDSLEGANLFNAKMDYMQKYHNGSNRLNSDKIYSGTHFIKVTPGEVLSFGPVVPTQGYQGVVHSTTGAGIGTINTANYPDNISTITLPSGLMIYNFTIPADAGYVTLIPSTTMNTLYCAQHGTMTEDDFNAAIGLDKNTNPLYGKSALFVGDSITHATQDAGINGFNTTGKSGWAIRIAAANGMSYMNNGVSGSSISTTRSARIITQLETYAANDYDFVVIHGGVNDAWNNAPVGSVSSSFDPATFNINTYAGGLEETFKRALELYGDKAAVFYLINFESPMHSYAEDSQLYFEVGKQVCEKWGIPYFDMASNKEISNALDIYTSGGKYVTDNIHPQPIGYDVLYPYIANYMKTITDYVGADNYGKIITELKEEAAAVKAEHFTTDSYTAFTAAIAAAGDDYTALVAAADKLVANATAPLSSAAGNTYYTKALAAATNLTVTSGADFNALATMATYYGLASGVTVTQTADIDLTGYSNTKVGNETHKFIGTYDGGNYTIKNVTLNDRGGKVALFPYVNGTLKNFTVDTATATFNNHSAIVASQVLGTSVINNVHVKNASITKFSGNGVAVLVCQPVTADHGVAISNCTVSNSSIAVQETGTISNTSFIVSRMLSKSTVDNCYVYNCSVSTKGTIKNHGDIAGEIEGGYIANSGAYNNTATGKVEYCGAIAGHAKNATISFTNCYTDAAKLLGGNNIYNETNAAATIVETNCYTAQSKAAIEDGSLAYTLKGTSGIDWVQTNMPMVAEGKAVAKVTYVVDGTTIATLYTDSTGKVIGEVPADPVKEGVPFMEWSAVTENGDTVYTAVFGDPMDINGNGVAGADDVVTVLRHLLGDKNVTMNEANADISGDGKISIIDAVLLLRMIAE